MGHGAIGVDPPPQGSRATHQECGTAQEGDDSVSGRHGPPPYYGMAPTSMVWFHITVP